ncbi:hypothetical protein VTN96DRAFT_8575 [Rasamsonia emersonii]
MARTRFLDLYSRPGLRRRIELPVGRLLGRERSERRRSELVSAVVRRTRPSNRNCSQAFSSGGLPRDSALL